jgi:predicted PurR-regulated permease PerM
MARLVSLIILAVLVIVFGVLFFQVMSGFLLPMFLAVLLAIMFRPVHHQISRWCGGHDRIAAALTTIAILLIVLAPVLSITIRAGSEAITMLGTGDSLRIDEAQFERFVSHVNEWSPVSINAKDTHDYIVAKSKEWLEAVAVSTPGTVGRILLGLFVLVFSLYYFLADGQEMMGSIVRLMPLRDKYQFQLVEEFEEVARAVITATVVSALCQGVLAAIGFNLARFDSVFLLILVAMLAEMIPVIGAAPVWLGAAAWLYFGDRTVAAIVLLVYGLVGCVIIDNVIRPIVLHGSSKLHPLLGLLSVIGGVQALGPIGLFVGPMAVAFLQAGLTMFGTELSALDKKRT